MCRFALHLCVIFLFHSYVGTDQMAEILLNLCMEDCLWICGVDSGTSELYGSLMLSLCKTTAEELTDAWSKLESELYVVENGWIMGIGCSCQSQDPAFLTHVKLSKSFILLRCRFQIWFQELFYCDVKADGLFFALWFNFPFKVFLCCRIKYKIYGTFFFCYPRVKCLF